MVEKQVLKMLMQQLLLLCHDLSSVSQKACINGRGLSLFAWPAAFAVREGGGRQRMKKEAFARTGGPTQSTQMTFYTDDGQAFESSRAISFSHFFTPPPC